MEQLQSNNLSLQKKYYIYSFFFKNRSREHIFSTSSLLPIFFVLILESNHSGRQKIRSFFLNVRFNETFFEMFYCSFSQQEWIDSKMYLNEVCGRNSFVFRQWMNKYLPHTEKYFQTKTFWKWCCKGNLNDETYETLFFWASPLSKIQ